MLRKLLRILKKISFRKKITPFSNNVIFLDTEFSSLDPYKGEILSVGMVKHTGEEFYIEIEYNGEYDSWVVKNVLPFLTGEKISREVAKQKIKAFVGEEKPYCVAYVDNLDMAYWFKLFGNSDDNPCDWISVDMASILFSWGINPRHLLIQKGNKFLDGLCIDVSKYRQHHALDDAKLLREVYMKLS